jgi:hypothetical protein
MRWPSEIGAGRLYWASPRFDGRKRKQDAGEFMARIVAKRLVEHLERARFVVMKTPPSGGAGPRLTGAIGSPG